jgi:CRP/FNR family transcriptional regulator, cyclic AMP receptor protein
MKSRLEEFIQKSRIFQLLDSEGRARLDGVADELSFKPGDVVVRQGEPGDAFYAILSGAIAVKAEDFGEEKQVAVLEAGSVCGEIAALTREPRTATLTAMTDVAVLRFEIVSVFGVLKDYPLVLAELNRLGVMRSEDLLEKMSGDLTSSE